ncbi:MAG TPA: hypothetical protein VEL11_09980 [Candidatus Bathyarchaeia archaeon]|nr:hypothetical protein [Candidatus Bathyarchaeia archaeon]
MKSFISFLIFDNLINPDFVHCIAGFDNAQSNIAQTSPAYKTGYDLGKQDK